MKQKMSRCIWSKIFPASLHVHVPVACQLWCFKIMEAVPRETIVTTCVSLHHLAGMFNMPSVAVLYTCQQRTCLLFHLASQGQVLAE